MALSTNIHKATRKIKQAATGEEPQVDILETLKEEHEEVQALLKKLVKSDSGAERKSLLAQIKTALIPHLRAEEKVVYDALILRKEKETKQDGEEGYLEHGLADKMLAALGKIDNALSAEFGAASKVLKDLVEHHVQEEENNVWSDIRDNFSDEARYQMNAEFLAAKKTVKIPH